MGMTDITLALLGDHEAAKRLTKQGVLLPCPCCKHEAVLIYGLGLYSMFSVRAKCKYCGQQTNKVIYDDGRKGEATKLVTRRWNTRAPILSAEEMEMLEGME